MTIVEPPHGFSIDFKELWHFRELLFFLVWRDVKVRYKQTALGAAWAIIQPVTAMVVFTVIFGRFAKIPSEGVPYEVFVFVGLLPWLYFSQAMSSSGASLVSSSNLITKVYFPRIIVPAAAIIVPLVDFVLAFSVLIALLGWHGIVPGPQVIALPAFLALALLTAAGVGLWLAALTVRYRDVPFALPFLTQLWLFATPVVYPLSIVPEQWRWLFSLNPMAGVLDGFRWALLDRPPPDASVIAFSFAAALILLASGFAYFQRVERHFADVI